MTRAISFLERRGGSSWAALPDGAGRAAARAEARLASGPTAVAPATAPEVVLRHARHVLTRARVTTHSLRQSIELLDEVLAADLLEVPIATLAEVAGSLVELSTAPPAAASWAWPHRADAAAVVLHGVGDDLRASTRLHRQMYARYTDAVWEVSDAAIRSGSSWRPVARWKLRRALAAASRSGRVHGRLSSAAKALIETRGARRKVASMASLLSTHLGEVDRGALTDVDAALTALAAVRRLQRAMGDALSPERLARLIEADAFRSAEVHRPAQKVVSTLSAWVHEVVASDGAGALELPIADLERWADELDHDLPTLLAGHEAAKGCVNPPARLADLVDLLLTRERVRELAGASAGVELPPFQPPARHQACAGGPA